MRYDRQNGGDRAYAVLLKALTRNMNLGEAPEDIPAGAPETGWVSLEFLRDVRQYTNVSSHISAMRGPMLEMDISVHKEQHGKRKRTWYRLNKDWYER